MDENEFKKIKPGDVIKNTLSGDRYRVHSNYGDRIAAVRTVDITNPSEWDLVYSSTSGESPDLPEKINKKSEFVLLVVAAVGLLFCGFVITNIMARNSEFKRNCAAMQGVVNYEKRGAMYCFGENGEFIDSTRR